MNAKDIVAGKKGEGKTEVKGNVCEGRKETTKVKGEGGKVL